MNRIGILTLTLTVVAAASALGCSHPGEGDKSDKTPAPAVALASAPAMQPSAPASPSKGGWEESFPENPPEKFTDGEKAFARVREAILKEYYMAGLTEDEVYRAAAMGVLEHVDPKMHKWNKLLSPAELAEIRSDLKGEIIGIGVDIRFEQSSGHIEITGVHAKSPAERAGLTGGDLIVSVNGKSLKGMNLHDVVGEIRGKAGDAVTLSVLRDDKLLPFTITREVVAIEEVTHQILGDGIGHVQIRGFAAKTVPALKEALEDLAAKQAKGLVVDLRLNQGGSFDDAVAAAELFLPSGTGIVSLRKRDGKEERIVSKGNPVLPTAPLLVLVSHATSSGAEFLASALQEGRHARVVGAKTFGKWSVQVINDLPNGYAFKFTTAQFFSPSGRTWDGVGLTPDVEVDMPDEQLEKACAISDADKRLAADSQLRTAVSILASRP